MENDTNISRCGFDLWMLEDPPIFMTILYIVFFVLGVVGNGILVLLFLIEKKLRDINNAFVTNLALSDFLFVLFIPIKFYEHYHIFRPMGTTFCVVSIISRYTSQDVSSFSLAAMAYFRCMVVVRPLKWSMHSQDRRLSRWIIFLCVLFWLVGIIVAIYPATKCNSCKTEDHIFQEIHFFDDLHGEGFFTYIKFRTVACFGIPSIIIAVFYSIMAVHLCKGQNVLGGNSSISARRATRSRKKLGAIGLAIATLFFVSWFPLYLSLYVVRVGQFGLFFMTFIFYSSEIGVFLPSSLNPLILMATSTDYRKSLHRLVLNCTTSPCTKLSFPVIRCTTLTLSLNLRFSRSRKVPSRTSLEMQSRNRKIHG